MRRPKASAAARGGTECGLTRREGLPAGVAIFMDGKGRWMDNVFIERLWRSVKWECVYLRGLETGGQARQALGDWFHFYNEQRPHMAFDGRRPMDVYWDGQSASKAA